MIFKMSARAYTHASMNIIIPIGIYCYFACDLTLMKCCEISDCQMQSVNKRYFNMSSQILTGEIHPVF